MSKQLDRKAVKTGIAELLDKGAVPSLPPCGALARALPEVLVPPPDGMASTNDVLKAVLERIFATTNEPYVRAAREHIGWTERLYEEVCDAARTEAKRPSSIKVLGSNDSNEAKELHKQALLMRIQVRRRLASFEIVDGGCRERTVKDSHTREIVNKLYEAFRTFINDPAEVQAVAVDLKLLPSSPKGEPSSTTELERSTDDAELQESDASYIHRDEIEREFKELVQWGVKLIALVGFPGMGKTSTARALTQGSPFIEFVDGKPYAAHLQQALVRYSDSAHVVQPGNEPALLGLLINQEPGPPFVLLDNLQSTAELRMIPPNTAVTVVATCRETGLDAPSWCKEIRIGAMKEDEAAQLAERKHDSLTRADAQFVANSLGRYPLLISLACRLASVTGMNIRTLCGELQLDPGDATLRADETLRSVATRAISFLRATDKVAVDLLTCVSYAGPLLLEHLQNLIESRYSKELAGISYAKAVSLLRDLALIEPDPLRFVTGLHVSNEQFSIGDMFSRYITPSAARFPGLILDENERVIILGIHPLVNALLKSLLKGDAFRLLDHLSTKLVEMLPEHDITLDRLGPPASLFEAIFDIYLGFQEVPNEAALEFARKLSASREVLLARLGRLKFESYANPAFEQTAQDVSRDFVEVLRRIAADGDENDRRYLHEFLEEMGA